MIESYESYLSRAVEPSARELDAFRAAVRAAQHFCLGFQRGQVQVWWFGRAEAWEADGWTFRGRPVRAFIKSGLPGDRPFEVALHELSHSWDFIHYPNITKAETERRAERLVARAMGWWR